MNPLQEKQFFGAESINRVSFLRSDLTYIGDSIAFANTHFVFYITGKSQIIPLVEDTAGSKSLVLQKYSQLPTHFQKLLVQWAHANEEQTEDLVQFGFKVVFLGIEETDSVTSSANGAKFTSKDGKYSGTPVYAVWVNDEILTSLSFSSKVQGLSQMMDYFEVPNSVASLISYGKMYLDWLHKYTFCPGCGSKMVPVDAGTRLLCLGDGAKCPIKSARVNNVCFPRTDPVVITCVANTACTKILLGLNKRQVFRKMYSCIAGFMEPSETIEMLTQREVWEETGCRASSLKILCSQPWPFPVNLMIGCVAFVDFDGTSEKIDLDHDKELEDARWFDVEELQRLILGELHPEEIQLPMDKSIAYNLIKLVIEKKF